MPTRRRNVQSKHRAQHPYTPKKKKTTRITLARGLLSASSRAASLPTRHYETPWSIDKIIAFIVLMVFAITSYRLLIATMDLPPVRLPRFEHTLGCDDNSTASEWLCLLASFYPDSCVLFINRLFGILESR